MQYHSEPSRSPTKQTPRYDVHCHILHSRQQPMQHARAGPAPPRRVTALHRAKIAQRQQKASVSLQSANTAKLRCVYSPQHEAERTGRRTGAGACTLGSVPLAATPKCCRSHETCARGSGA